MFKICPLIVEVLKRAAATNGKHWTTAEIKSMIPINRTSNKTCPGFRSFLRSPNMRLKTILLSINWYMKILFLF